MHPQPSLPRSRRWLLNIGTLLALCVYYLNYGATFDEGEIQGGGSWTLLMRASAVGIIVLTLLPLRFRPGSTWCYVGLYLAGAASLSLASGLHGSLNDSFFFNTLLQLPVLVALDGTRWQVDYPRWMRFICQVLAVQTLVDVLVWQTGESLWLSMAFVGGAGNPSSFGMLCATGMAFCVFHPRAGRGRWVLAATLAVGAVQTKALFSVFAVALVAGTWMAMGWRRALVGLFVGTAVALAALTLFTGMGDDSDMGFVEHKLSAAGALLGLVEYDVDSSASVSQRLEMHEQTFTEIAAAPQRLLWGHLGRLPYWPMDSQLLTYLGSFGAPFVAVFLLLHLYWTACAWRQRHVDKGFALLVFCLFGLIFTTNRVLDYYPIATLYFLVVTSVLRARPLSRRSRPSDLRASVGSTGSSYPVPRPAALGASSPVSRTPA